MQPCWVSDISLYADTTYASLTQVMRAIVELAAPSPEQEHGRGCHQHPGAGQVPEQEYGGGGTSCCTEPRVGSSGGGCISLLPPRGEGCASKMHRHSYSTFPQLPVRLQCLKQAWIFLFTPTLAYLPKGNCVGFVLLSLYISEVKQRDVANGIILTHLCRCY